MSISFKGHCQTCKMLYCEFLNYCQVFSSVSVSLIACQVCITVCSITVHYIIELIITCGLILQPKPKKKKEEKKHKKEEKASSSKAQKNADGETMFQVFFLFLLLHVFYISQVQSEHRLLSNSLLERLLECFRLYKSCGRTRLRSTCRQSQVIVFDIIPSWHFSIDYSYCYDMNEVFLFILQKVKIFISDRFALSIVFSHNSKHDVHKLYFIFQLSKMRFATVTQFRGKKMVNIREFYEKDGELAPGRKGITPVWPMFLQNIY